MNRRINKSIDVYLTTFKDAVFKKGEDPEITVVTLLQFIDNYAPLILKPSDYEKRQRTKNIVPLYERCKAKRACGEQCTRRKKANGTLCGTHIKGTPHGIMDIKAQENVIEKIDVWVQDINGINYYIDDNNNIYDPQDVYQHKITPRKIHKYVKNDKGEFIITDI